MVQEAYLRAWKGIGQASAATRSSRRGCTGSPPTPPSTHTRQAPPPPHRAARRRRRADRRPRSSRSPGRAAESAEALERDRRRRSTSCRPSCAHVVVLKDVYGLLARGHRRRARHLGRRRRRSGCTGPGASCGTCCTTRERKPMRCDEVAALLPGLVDGDAGRPRRRAPRRVVPALPGRAGPVPPAAAHLQLLRTRYLEPTPGLLAETLAALDEAPSAGSSAPLLSGRRLAYAGASAARRSRPRPPRPPSLVARSRRRSPAERPRPSPADARSRRRAVGDAARCYPRRPAPAARRAVAQLAEHRSPKPAVGGSSPSCPAPITPIRTRDAPRPMR